MSEALLPRLRQPILAILSEVDARPPLGQTNVDWCDDCDNDNGITRSGRVRDQFGKYTVICGGVHVWEGEVKHQG